MNPYLLLMFWGIYCSSAHTQTTITGRIDDLPGWKPMLYLSCLERYQDIFSGFDGMVIDSAAIAPDGHFSFKPARYKAGFYRLNIQAAGSEIMAGLNVGVPYENYIHFYIHPEDKRLLVTARASGLTRSAQLEGNVECSLFRQMRDLREPLVRAVDDNWTLMTTAQQVPADEQMKIRNQVVEEITRAARDMQQRLRVFIDSTTNLQAGILGTAYYNLGDNFARYAPYFDSLIVKWSVRSPGNVYLAGLKSEVDDFNHFIPLGSQAPDIRLPNPAGDSISLFEVPAKLILLDFWASWCGPCRAENRNTVLPLYAEHHSAGLNIYSVSLDTDAQKWQQAIEKDHYSWTQVIDRAGIVASEVARLYKIASIPTTYLLDENGVVLAKNLRGNQLADFVRNYLEN